MTRSDSFDLLDRVLDEFLVARIVMDHAIDSWGTDDELRRRVTSNRFTLTAVCDCREAIEIAYVLRAFSAFEGVLRDYWLRGLGRTTVPDMTTLLTSLAARRAMTAADAAEIHEVREMRNQVVHNGLDDLPFKLSVCLKRMSRFLRWLPLEW